MVQKLCLYWFGDEMRRVFEAGIASHCGSDGRRLRLACGLQNVWAQEQPTRMLRITVVESSANTITLRVEGRIAGPWLEELRRTCDAHRGTESARLQLELEDVGFVDAAGVAYLKELQGQGAVLIRVSPFLTELFKNDSSPPDASAHNTVKRKKPRFDGVGG